MRAASVFSHAQAVRLLLVLLVRVSAANVEAQRRAHGSRLGLLSGRIARVGVEASQASGEMSMALDELNSIKTQVEQHRSRVLQREVGSLTQSTLGNIAAMMGVARTLMEDARNEMDVLAATAERVGTDIDALCARVDQMGVSEEEVNLMACHVSVAMNDLRQKRNAMSRARGLFEAIRSMEKMLSNAT